MKVPRYRWFLWAAFLAAALFFVIQMRFLPGGLKPAAPKGFELLDSLMRLIRTDYLEEKDPVQTAEGTFPPTSTRTSRRNTWPEPAGRRTPGSSS
jgi:hypothetical protein